MQDTASYAGKRVVVTGCSSGMGEAAARMLADQGASVHGCGRRRPEDGLAAFTPLDLGDPASIAAAVEELGAQPIDALFNFAGLNSSFEQIDIVRVNFVGTRVFTEALLPHMAPGGAIVSASSLAGMGWRQQIDRLRPLMELKTFEENLARFEEWLAEGRHAYVLAKEAMIFWTAYMSATTIRQGVRMNCIVPGPTLTPFMETELTLHPQSVFDMFSQPSGRASTAEEQAAPAIFLNSAAAGRVNGQALAVDGGFEAGVISGNVTMG